MPGAWPSAWQTWKPATPPVAQEIPSLAGGACWAAMLQHGNSRRRELAWLREGYNGPLMLLGQWSGWQL